MISRILLGTVALKVIQEHEELHRCGKTTTTLVARNGMVDITIIAEGKPVDVVAKLGGTAIYDVES